MGARTGLRLLTWAERLLLTTGAVLLAWCAFAIVEQHAAQYFAHETLVTMPRVEPPAAPPDRPRRAPAPGTPLGELSIPRLRLSAVVLHGSDARTLRRGVGHIENTALPGDPGNIAIAGHRDTFFRPLEHVRVGDEVDLETPQGRLRYHVVSLRVVPPSDVSVLRPTRDATLTLVTCYPFWVFGHAPDRFIVRATRVADYATSDAALVRTSSPVEAVPSVPPSPPPSRSARAAAPEGRIPNDDALVRQAIERFRVTYNARFTSQVEQSQRLRFRDCHVTVAGEHASAVCQTASPGPDGLDILERRFELRKAGGVWTIRSFAMFP